MNLPIAQIVTIVNVKTKEVKGFWLAHPEEIEEYEGMLGQDEAMYVNDLEGTSATKAE